MFLNTLHRTLCVNNRTVLKSLLVTFVNEGHKVSTCKKYYSTLDTFPEYSQRRTVDKLDFSSLHNFRKQRNFLTKTRDYENTSTRKLNIREILNPETIESIKSVNWSQLTSNKILKNFKLLSVNALQKHEKITGEDYRKMISVMTEKCWKFSDRELHIILKCLELWPDIGGIRDPSNHVYKLLEELDNQLNERSHSWSVNKTLMYCDTICRIFNFHSNFVYNSLNRLSANPSTLSYTNIVQLMYYLFIYGIPKSRVRQLEPYIEHHFDKFTTEELGIICFGYFRTQVHITSDTLLCKLMQKVIDDVDNISNIDMGAFFKTIRYSFMSKLRCVQKCEELLEKIIPKVPLMVESVITHLSHLMADSQIYNAGLLKAIIERFTNTIEKMRLKDIERMIFLMSSFNVPSTEPLYNIIIEELKRSHRDRERKNFPKEFGFALRHLAVANIYPLDLISIMMSREHMNLTYGPNPDDLGVEYLILDQSIEIEVPQYKGPRIENATCNMLTKKYAVEAKNSFASQSKEQIVEILNYAFKHKNAACLQRILPHFTQTDIVLCLDENNKAIAPKPILEEINSQIKRVPEKFRNRNWLAIVFATETLMIRGTNQFTGNLSTKLRHLEKVGYMPVVVTYNKWWTFQTNFQRYKYLEKKISESIKLQRKKEIYFEDPLKDSHAL